MPSLLDPGALLDRVRRDAERSLLRTRNGLKHLAGVGRPVMQTTPKQTVWSQDKVELWRYENGTRRLGPPLLLVHSLVSRSYVFDLAPGNSVVEFLTGRGFDVFLVDWGVPDELEAFNTLETYTDGYLPDIVRQVRRIAGSEEVNLFGYCMGGVLSLLYLAGHAADPIRSLAVLATPIDFDHMGPFTSLLQEGRVTPDAVIDPTGNVPAEVMLNSFRILQPTADITGYVNLWQNMWDDDYLAAHQIMTQWSRDHIPFPGACFRQVTDLLTRQNLLKTGRLPLGGRTVDLADITVPFLNIVGEKDHIVPPAANGDLTHLVGSADAQELLLPAGHVGLVVGRSAHRRHLPAMAQWLEARSEERR
jgi:polyhydroxyalkanoate synthase